MNIVKKIYKILRVAVVVAALAALCFEGYIKKDYEAYKQRAIPALMYHSISEVPEGWTFVSGPKSSKNTFAICRKRATM